MFKLSQESRRRMCRAGFLLGCLLPAAGLATSGAYRQTSFFVRSHETVLSNALGLRTA